MLPPLSFTIQIVFSVLSVAANALGSLEEPTDYQQDVRPILARSCFACHGNDAEHREAGLRLDTREGATETLRSGSAAIKPGDSESSELLFRISETDDNIRMPPKKSGELLKPAEIEIIRKWIAEGANYSEHWAFIGPVARPLPAPTTAGVANRALDLWVQNRLSQAKLTPSPPADRFTLLRRLSLDLRGLPPSPEEIARFKADQSPAAYEKMVDRFLADPSFGERWARPWLDLARYADSAGYGSDPLRPNMWRYRDWVIDAFNSNEPYDKFATEQIAGDLLPDPSLSQRVATAFHRNTMTNTDGGTDDEEFRSAAIKDRVDTTGQVFMGITVGCAKCHNHKYDPISQSEYYQLYAFFNQSSDNDQPDESPTIPAPTTEQSGEISRTDARVSELKAQIEAPNPALDAAQTSWENELRKPLSWIIPKNITTRSISGTDLNSGPDGVVRASGPNPSPEVYSLDLGLVGNVTAVRLETLPDSAFPGGGAGRSPDGNFVLSRVSLESESAEAKNITPIGRFVRITLPGQGKILSLAEVEVFSGGQNRGPLGRATQSSTDYVGAPERAIDGNTSGEYFQANSTTHTGTENSPWWEVALPDSLPIDKIVIWNRTDGGSGARLTGFMVEVLDENRMMVWNRTVAETPNPSLSLALTNRKIVPISAAVADFEQKGFPVSSAIQAKIDPSKGWAVGPEISQPHSAVFALANPVSQESQQHLILSLEFGYKEIGYTLGRFRVSTSDSVDAINRSRVPGDVLNIVDIDPASRTPEQAKAVTQYFRSISQETESLRTEITRLEKARPKAPVVPIMAELPAERRRVTRILNKGNFLDPGADVEPGFPRAFGARPTDAPLNRLGVARWLTNPGNPLTARVAVNRVWAQCFGTGLVETEEDFGTQGELPSHPEMLDMLALHLIDSGWDLKGILRTIVTSATYQQTSTITSDRLERDPRNRLLSRGPRFRLEAEHVRDQALVLSGLLCRKIGGPSVFPPQPEGLWQAAFNGERTWSTSPGNDRHRRGLYTFWRRTVPYPSMATFDAPSREICAVRRIRTNTPLQAFVTLNDPVYIEAAQALGRRLVSEGGATVEDRIRYGLSLCLGRPAQPEQVAVLITLFEEERTRYAADHEAAILLATDPLGPLPEGLNPAAMAAWTSVANVLLNLDGVLTKG